MLLIKKEGAPRPKPGGAKIPPALCVPAEKEPPGLWGGFKKTWKNPEKPPGKRVQTVCWVRAFKKGKPGGNPQPGDLAEILFNPGDFGECGPASINFFPPKRRVANKGEGSSFKF